MVVILQSIVAIAQTPVRGGSLIKQCLMSLPPQTADSLRFSIIFAQIIQCVRILFDFVHFFCVSSKKGLPLHRFYKRLHIV